MTDIVERLRLGTQDPDNDYYQDMADAADEIERLRGELASAEEAILVGLLIGYSI